MAARIILPSHFYGTKPYVDDLEFASAVRHVHQYPGLYNGLPWPPRYADIITTLTGYDVVTDGDGFFATPPWSSYIGEQEASNRLLSMAPVVFRATWRQYFYRRDIVAALLPRWRCAICGAKAPLYSTYLAYGDVVLHRSTCTKECRKFQASRRYSLFHKRETMKYWEHALALVCSPACHNERAREYQRLTLDAQEKRTWVREGTEALKMVQAVLPRPRRGKRSRQVLHSPSPPAESNPRRTSET